MTKLATVTSVLQRLGQRQSDAALATSLKLEFDIIQGRLESGVQLPNGGIFMLQGLLTVDTTNITLVSGNSALQGIPTAFLQELEGEGESPLEYLDTSTGNYIALKKDDFQLLKAKYNSFSTSNSVSAELQAYAQRGDRGFTIFPTPTKAYTMRWAYYAREATITDNQDNAFTTTYNDLMINEIGIIACKFYIISPDRLPTFQDSRDKEAVRIYNRQIMQEQSGRNYSQGED